MDRKWPIHAKISRDLNVEFYPIRSLEYSKEMFYKYPSIFYTPDVMLLRVGKNKDLFMVIRRDFILRVLNSEKSTSR